MVSDAMQSAIDGFRARKATRGAQPPPSLEELRAGFAPGGRVFPVPDDVEVEAVALRGVPATWLRPPGAARDAVLLYLHGGGFQAGDVRSHGELAARLARAAGTVALLPEYRLVPEHPYPAAVADVHEVWRGLRESGVPAASIVVAGDSAGGALALALVVHLRDAGDDLPAALLLLSPMLDMSASGESVTAREDRDPIFTADFMRATGAAYAGDADLRDPGVSPAFADLTSLPPLLVQVGTEETLFSDGADVVTHAQAAGVDAQLDVGEGLPHVYQTVGDAPEAVAATDRGGAFLRERLAAR